ncbi:MAG: VWA domain-containing protein [Pseudomonadota bacterium]
MVDAEPAIDGKLVDNIVHFARALRKAGIRVGPAQVESAVRAVAAAGFTHRVDFYHVLRATLITRADHLETFHQVFAMFWREPEFLETMLSLMSPKRRDDKPAKPKASAHRRAAEAMADLPERAPEVHAREEVLHDASLSWSPNERLRHMDFEQMSAAEIAEAQRAVDALSLPVPPLVSRRYIAQATGARADARRTLRTALRRGGDVEVIARRSPRPRAPDLVALTDISGSMSVYARFVMRFLYAVAHTPGLSWGGVSAFTFGTRLTNVTRALREPDPDAALAAIGHGASDWDGGTRIGLALRRFNKDWSRRVLGTSSVVLLITDGLERGETDALEREIERLSLSTRRLIWLNPLLRWEGFAPRAAGIRAMLPHVDSVHACHSVGALIELSAALGKTGLKERLIAAM